MVLKKYLLMLLAVDFSINKLVFEEHLEKFWYEWGYCTIYFRGKRKLIYGNLCSFTMYVINSTPVPSLICPSLNIIRDFWFLQYLVYSICLHFINSLWSKLKFKCQKYYPPVSGTVSLESGLLHIDFLRICFAEWSSHVEFCLGMPFVWKSWFIIVSLILQLLDDGCRANTGLEVCIVKWQLVKIVEMSLRFLNILQKYLELEENQC